MKEAKQKMGWLEAAKKEGLLLVDQRGRVRLKLTTPTQNGTVLVKARNDAEVRAAQLFGMRAGLPS